MKSRAAYSVLCRFHHMPEDCREIPFVGEADINSCIEPALSAGQRPEQLPGCVVCL